MSKSYDQPVRNSNNIIISDARILIKTYAENYQFSGSAMVDIDNPPDGFIDCGLVSQATLTTTKDEIKLEVGLPLTTVKTAEKSRQVAISFNFHEIGAETVALITGANKYNVLAAAKVESGSASNTTTTHLRYASQFKVGDNIVQLDVAGTTLGTDDATIASIIGTGLLHAANPFTTAASTGDYVLRAGKIVSAPGGSGKVFTVGAAEGLRFAAGDLVTFATPVTNAAQSINALRNSPYRYRVVSSTNATVTVDQNIVTGTEAPALNDILCAYNSVELVDQLGSQIRRTVLMLFDYQDDAGSYAQYCLYFPRMKATGAFSPDFKGGQDYANVPAGFAAEAVSLLMADGTTQRVMVVPYAFAA